RLVLLHDAHAAAARPGVRAVQRSVGQRRAGVVIAAADRIAGGVAGGPGVPPGAPVEAVLLIGVRVEVVLAVGQVRRAVRGALRRAGGDAHPGAAGAGVRAVDRRVGHAGDRHVI